MPVECRCLDGWYPLIHRLFDQIVTYCQTAGKPYPRVVQIKEKLGALRVYLDIYADVEIKRLRQEAEVESTRICEICGAPGALVNPLGCYVQTLCPEDLKAIRREDALHAAWSVLRELDRQGYRPIILGEIFGALGEAPITYAFAIAEPTADDPSRDRPEGIARTYLRDGAFRVLDVKNATEDERNAIEQGLTLAQFETWLETQGRRRPLGNPRSDGSV